MVINNPYIDLVKNHQKIFIDTQKIYAHNGKWSHFFGNQNDIVLEIGTGLGNFFSKEVNENPNYNFIGMEIRYKRLYQTAEKSLGNAKNNDNSRDNTSLETYNNNFILFKDFGENIDKIFAENELTKTIIFFPDPWTKKKKWLVKRLMQRSFLNNLYLATKSGGTLIFKTDHKGYFDFSVKELQYTKWKVEFKTFDYEKEGLYNQNAITEFEQIFRGQDTKVHYLELKK